MMIPGASRLMSTAERCLVYVAFALLWVSGCGWLVLNSFYQVTGEFGLSPHPWQPPLLLVHGLLAVPAIYLIGWVAARHASINWRASLRRSSGSAFSAVLLVLSVSGFALFFLTDDRAQRLAALTHEGIGLAFTLFALEHWLFGRKEKSR
jgi:hypothetical protein